MKELQPSFHRTTYALHLSTFVTYGRIHEERFEDLRCLDESSPGEFTLMKSLGNAFKLSFKEGLVLFFSPFEGFWRAVASLRLN